MPENKEPTAGAAAGTESPDALTRIEQQLAALGEAITKSATPVVTELASLAPAVDAGKASLASRLTPRMLACLVLAVALVAGLAVVSPPQLPVAGYKLCLVVLAGLLGYWLDRWLFPYARPDGYLVQEWRAHGHEYPDSVADFEVVPGYETVFAAANLRRALVVLGAMLAMGLGL